MLSKSRWGLIREARSSVQAKLVTRRGKKNSINGTS